MVQNETNIKGCYFFEPLINKDCRGSFTEIYKFSKLPTFIPAQSNCSSSKKGVLRGIHRTPYSKLITCIKGKVYDVCVDLRENSPTYKEYFSIELTDSNLISLYIPEYCGHAFLAMEDSIIIYHQNQEYNTLYDETFCYKNYNIKWPDTPIHLSHKDTVCCNEPN